MTTRRIFFATALIVTLTVQMSTAQAQETALATRVPQRQETKITLYVGAVPCRSPRDILTH